MLSSVNLKGRKCGAVGPKTQADDQAERLYGGIGRPVAVKRSYQSVSEGVELDEAELDVLSFRSRIGSDRNMFRCKKNWQWMEVIAVAHMIRYD